MNNLKKLVVAFCLMSVLAITAVGGEIPSPPCSPPVPGEIDSPPCSSAQLTIDDPANPVETQAPPAADTVAITTIVDAAVGALLSIW